VFGFTLSFWSSGFFDDRAADAKARGEKLASKEDKEAEFREFQAGQSASTALMCCVPGCKYCANVLRTRVQVLR
jgi:hypothetical protein